PSFNERFHSSKSFSLRLLRFLITRTMAQERMHTSNPNVPRSTVKVGVGDIENNEISLDNRLSAYAVAPIGRAVIRITKMKNVGLSSRPRVDFGQTYSVSKR